MALDPAKRPPSGPGWMMPVLKDLSSALNEWGLPPTLATSNVVPAATSSLGVSKRSDSPSMLVGSIVWTRTTGDGVPVGVTTTMPFIFTGLMRQK